MDQRGAGGARHFCRTRHHFASRESQPSAPGSRPAGQPAPTRCKATRVSPVGKAWPSRLHGLPQAPPGARLQTDRPAVSSREITSNQNLTSPHTAHFSTCLTSGPGASSEDAAERGPRGTLAEAHAPQLDLAVKHACSSAAAGRGPPASSGVTAA